MDHLADQRIELVEEATVVSSALPEMDALDGIQYVPEPGTGLMDCVGEFRRVKDAGRKLCIPCAPKEVRPLLEAIGAEGVFLSVHCKTETGHRRHHEPRRSQGNNRYFALHSRKAPDRL